MEYTYRNSLKEEETTIQLQTYDMVIIVGKNKKIIPYAEVSEVRLDKRKNTYFLDIQTPDCGTFHISSQTFGSTRERIDQSRIYMTFARVLHIHLLEKSKPTYHSGVNLNRILFLFAFLTIVATLVFFFEDYFDLISASSIFLGSATFLAGLLLLLVSQLNHLPKRYDPASIPMNLLPSAT